MGVRFQCPNGHQLNVKAELAGRRAICPECGEKFIVPSFSGQRVPVDVGGPPAPPNAARVAPAAAVAATTAPPAPRPPGAGARTSPAPQPPPMAPAAEPVAWYIRPAAGGQFGPASEEVFRLWVGEGRVAPDSWVWRTGWADWRPASEALAPASPAALPKLDAASPISAVANAVSMVDSAPAVPIDPTTAAGRRAEIKRRKALVRKVSMILGLVALVMLVLLVLVLAR